MKNTAYKILLLGSLALFLNSCDSSKTDSKDKTTDKTSQKEDEMIIGVGTSDDPNADVNNNDSDYTVEEFQPEEESDYLLNAIKKDPRNEKEILASFIDKTPSKEEVFKGYVFKPHLNDYFDTLTLKKVSVYTHKARKLLNDPTFLLNTEDYKRCIFSRGGEAILLSKDLTTTIPERDCDEMLDYKPIYLDINNNQENNIEIKPLDILLTTKETPQFVLNKKTPFMKKIWDGVATPYLFYRIPLTLEPVDKSKIKPPTALDLMAIAQKFISKYINNKWGDSVLIPDEKLRNIYKKMFVFDPTSDFYTLNNNNKLVKTDKPWVYSYKNNKEGTKDISNWYPESNSVLDININNSKKNTEVGLGIHSCKEALLSFGIGYYNHKISIFFVFPLVTSNNIFFDYLQSSKPLEEGGILPKETFDKVHQYLGDACYNFS